MHEPLDYRNPKNPEVTGSARPTARAAVPIEFDLLLTRTQDHAGARAIEAQLKREKIAVFCTEDDGARALRWIELYIRADDAPRAQQTAGEIFNRRKKIKSFPRPQMPPNIPERPGDIDGILF
jgi:hypothetical protein